MTDQGEEKSSSYMNKETEKANQRYDITSDVLMQAVNVSTYSIEYLMQKGL